MWSAFSFPFLPFRQISRCSTHRCAREDPSSWPDPRHGFHPYGRPRRSRPSGHFPTRRKCSSPYKRPDYYHSATLLRRVPGSVFISLRKKRRAFRLAAFVSIENLQSATHLRYLRNQDLPPLELLLDVECKDRQLLSVLLL